MSDERPAQPSPSEGAQPDEPAASTPPPDAPEAAADAPAPATPVGEAAPTVEHAAASDEAPTVADPEATAATATAAEATPPPSAVAPAPADRGRGVFVPVWVAAVVAVLLVAGLGFAIGWIAAPGDDSDTSSAVATSPNGGSTDRGADNGNDGAGSGNDNRTLPAPDDDQTVPPLVSGAYLGVTLEQGDDSSVRIGSVAEDSPAAEAGLQAGDVITAVDGDEITSPLDLVRAIREHDPDDEITVTYTRNGNSAEAQVTLAERPERQSVS